MERRPRPLRAPKGMEPAPAVNEGLRSHVTRVGFNLSLGRTQIAALVWLNEAMDRYVPTNRIPVDSPLRLVFANHAVGIAGCITRGLVLHHYNAEHSKAHPNSTGMRAHYTITRAGELVIDLLREAGLYDEYAAVLPKEEVS